MLKESVLRFTFFSLMFFLVFIPSILSAQLVNSDTLRLSTPEAEKIFLQKNLALLSAKYNIDANKALIQQAKLWDNPVLNTDQSIYDGKFFRHDANNGQVYIQVQQLIKTAGKRSKLAQLATDNTTLAQQQFDDVMRSLRYSLQTDLLETNHLLKIKAVYDNEITEVEKLVKGMDEVYKLGDISMKENMRLKALLFGLQNELVNVNAQLIPVQAEIRLLLQASDNAFVLPQLDYHLPDLINASLPNADSLLIIANNNRPDVQMAKTQLVYQQHNLTYQKALAKPDITIGPEYDRLSSYVPNLFGLSISLPLNIFNKNQGNIKSAQYSIKQQETELSLETDKIKNEVMTSRQKVVYYQSINNKEQLDFSNNYDKLLSGVLESYRARQISLLDFTDFLDSYKDSKLKLIEQHNALVESVNELNYTVNQNIINL